MSPLQGTAARPSSCPLFSGVRGRGFCELRHDGVLRSSENVSRERTAPTRLWSASHAQTHHPAPLGDPSVPAEAELLEQGLGAGVQVGPALRRPPFDLFRVGLDDAPAGLLDRRQSGADGGTRDPLASVRLVGEDAADPPVRQAAEVLGVGLGVLDVTAVLAVMSSCIVSRHGKNPTTRPAIYTHLRGRFNLRNSDVGSYIEELRP